MNGIIIFMHILTALYALLILSYDGFFGRTISEYMKYGSYDKTAETKIKYLITKLHIDSNTNINFVTDSSTNLLVFNEGETPELAISIDDLNSIDFYVYYSNYGYELNYNLHKVVISWQLKDVLKELINNTMKNNTVELC